MFLIFILLVLQYFFCWHRCSISIYGPCAIEIFVSIRIIYWNTMAVYYLLTLTVSIIIFVIAAIEYRYGFVFLGKFKLRIIKREENSGLFKLIILMHILFGIILLMISIYIYYSCFFLSILVDLDASAKADIPIISPFTMSKGTAKTIVLL